MSVKQTFISLLTFKYKFNLKYLFNRLGIRQKITYGYALAIGIAMLGATAGKLIENYYQEQAKNNSLSLKKLSYF